MLNADRVEVRLWGKTVGMLILTGKNIVFRYDDRYLGSGHSLSPIHLPLERRPFQNTLKRDVFEGLPGVFADSLPDLYGKKIIRHFFQKKYGAANYDPGGIHKLMYIGDRGLGALEYHPADQQTLENNAEAFELAAMVAFAKKVIDGNLDYEPDAQFVLSAIMQSGSQAGGARPKAIIGWNRQNNQIISGVPPLPDGFEHWLIKFDGTRGMPEDWGKVEFVYSEIARLCGIEMTETRLVRENGRAHFMTKRFDIDDVGNRLHMHSLAGMLHIDFNEQRSLDYTQFFDTVRLVTKNEAEVKKAWQRMVFNVVGRNCDDHTKNFSFLMEPSGKWRLSPQYDLCYSYASAPFSWVHEHQMTLLGKTEFSDKDLLEAAKRFDIEDASVILEEIRAAFAQWPQLAKEQGIAPDLILDCSSHHKLTERTPKPAITTTKSQTPSDWSV